MRGVAAILVLALAALLSGCAGYRLGPSNGQSAGDRTVQIAPFANRTLEPRLGDAATSALRKEIQREGTFRLANDNYTDLIVTGEIIQYNRGEVSFLPVDVVTARDYKMDMTARVVARERITGKVVLERDLTGSALMRVGADLPSVERQTLPLLAADLARQITAALADGTW
jgi:hypothetical protein